MFRGQVTLYLPKPELATLQRSMPVVFLAMPLALGVTALTLYVSPQAQKFIGAAFGLLGAVCVSLYVSYLNRVLVPDRRVAVLVADVSGIWLDGVPYLARMDMSWAYIRPAMEAWWIKGVAIPSRPMTVELITRRGQVNVDAGSEQACRELLLAIGVTPMVVAPTYRPPSM